MTLKLIHLGEKGWCQRELIPSPSPGKTLARSLPQTDTPSQTTQLDYITPRGSTTRPIWDMLWPAPLCSTWRTVRMSEVTPSERQVIVYAQVNAAVMWEQFNISFPPLLPPHIPPRSKAAAISSFILSDVILQKDIKRLGENNYVSGVCMTKKPYLKFLRESVLCCFPSLRFGGAPEPFANLVSETDSGLQRSRRH